VNYIQLQKARTDVLVIGGNCRGRGQIAALEVRVRAPTSLLGIVVITSVRDASLGVDPKKWKE